MTEFSEQVFNNLDIKEDGSNPDTQLANAETESQRLLSQDAVSLPVNIQLATDKASTISISTTEKVSDLDQLILSSEGTRMTYVAGKGMAGIPLQAANAFRHDLENPEQLGAKLAGGFAFGAAMRTALAKSGVGRAVAGSVFAFWMVKDAAVPVGESMRQAWHGESMKDLDNAANLFSGGLGHFTYDSVITIGAANLGERVTEKALRGALGNRRFSKFESAKEEVWVSGQNMIGRGINRVSETLGGPKELIGGVRKPVAVEGPQLSDIARAQRTEAGLAEYRHHVEVAKTYTRGAELKTGERVGLSETLFLLERGKNPRALTSAEANAVLASGEIVPLASMSRKLKVAETGKPGEKPAGDATAKPKAGDGKGAEKPPANESIASKVERETHPDRITEMSQQMKEQMGAWDQKSMALADRVEGDIAPVVSALKTKHKPLDSGYGEFAQQMFLLAEQVKHPQHYQQVGTLFGYARDAANQYNLGRATQTAELAQSLNLFSREIHTGLKDGLRRAGVKPEEVLNAKNPPLFTVRNDGGAGPHTIPEIQGVWDVDVVLWPRNMIEARSTATSGINGHEIGHNQYGGLLRFEESIRDKVIGNAVAKGLESHRRSLGKDAKVSDTVEVPGHGKVAKQELYEGILKAQANENTADIWGTAWTGPNSALSLGVLLQSLRAGGKLETRNVMGKEFVGDGNRFGFEVHGIDRFRVKLSAEVLRQRSNGDPLVLEYAKALDRYADKASREGDYVWASLDVPRKSVTVSKAEFEAMIPHLVSVQLNQPLPALKGRTFGEILPDLPTQVRKMDELASIIVDGAKAGRDPSRIPFDVNTYTINQVFGSGMPAQLRLMSEGMSAKDANMWVNRYSDHFRAQYLEKGNPHVEAIGKSYRVDQLKLDPGAVNPSIRRAASGRIGQIGQRVGNRLERHAPALSGYMGGTLAESIFTENKRPTYLDISRFSVAQDAEAMRDITENQKGH